MRVLESSTAERRLATFARCDIVDSTRWSQLLDLEDQQQLSRAFRSTVLDVAARHNGHVMRYEGDAVLLSFGHPDAREDAPESAIRGALDLVDAVRRLDVVDGVELELRIGIASGEVAVGEVITAGQREAAVDGPVPAMAERLRALGDGGDVLVCETTRRLAGAFFEYVDLGVQPAKGFEAGLRAWRVLGETAVASRFEAQRLEQMTHGLFGRSDVIGQLGRLWDSTRAGQGQAVLLSGEPGVGKSRLAHEMRVIAAARNDTVLQIDCKEHAAHVPLYPFGVMLRRLAGMRTTHDEAERRSRALHLLAGIDPGTDPSLLLAFAAPVLGLQAVTTARITPGEIRDESIALVVRLICALARQQPLLLVCEDLHWADATTVAVLAGLLDTLPHSRCMVFGTTRPDAAPQIVNADLHRIDLPGLPDEEAANLVRSLTPRLPETAVRSVVARGEGMPLFLEEFARDAAESEAQASSAPEIPATLQLVMQARMARWPQLRSFVHAAAVLGRDFSVELLQRMLREPSEQVTATITLLGRHGVFAPEPATSERAQFRHALIRDTVYRTILRGDRRRLHALAADVIVSEFAGSADAAPGVLAHHFALSERFAEAARLGLKALMASGAQGAFVESIGLCETVLQWVERIRDEEERRSLRLAVLVQRAVALAGKDGYADPEVELAYGRASEACDDGMAPAMRYPIVRGLCAVQFLRGKLESAYRLSEHGVELARTSGNTAYLIDALSMHVYTTMYFGSLAECMGVIDDFFALYDVHAGSDLSYPCPHDPATSVLSVLPTVAWQLGDEERAEAAVLRGLAHVERLARPFDEAMLHSWLAGTRYTQRRYAEAASHAGKAVQIAAARGFREWLVTAGMLGWLSQAVLQPGPGVVDSLRQACAGFDLQKVGLNASYWRWGLARGEAGIGEWDLAAATLAEGLARAKASQETRMDAELMLLQAEHPGEGTSRLTRLRQAASLARQQGALPVALRAVALIVLETVQEEPARLRARAALDRLDGTVSHPPDSHWMSTAFERLEHALSQPLVA